MSANELLWAVTLALGLGWVLGLDAEKTRSLVEGEERP